MHSERPEGSFEASEYKRKLKPTRENLMEVARNAASHLGLAGNIVDVQDPSHDYLHVVRVMNTAETLIRETGADNPVTRDKGVVDENVVRAIVVGHDLVTRSKKDPLSIRDTEAAAEYIAHILSNEFEVTDAEIEKVMRGTVQSSHRKGLIPDTPEAKIVYVADKLDQSGAIAIMRYFSSGGGLNRTFYHNDDPLAKSGRTLEPMKYTIDAMLERIPQINQTIQGKNGVETIIAPAKTREIMARRTAFVDKFLAELAIELEELKLTKRGWVRETGALGIMKTFDGSGRAGLTFYDEHDPFRRNSKIEPKKHPIDRLLDMQKRFARRPRKDMPEDIRKRREQFLNDFIEEFKLELEGK